MDLAPAGQVRLGLLAGLFLDVLEKLQVLGLLEVEVEAAVGAVQLEGVVVLAAAGVAGGFEGAQGAVSELGEEHAGVVDADGLHLAGDGVLALLDEGLRPGGDAGDGAVEPHGGVDGVGQQVAGDAGAGHFDIEAPEGRAALGDLGRDRPVLKVGGAVVEGAADAAFVDDLAGQGDGRHAAVVEPDHVRHAGVLDGPDHLLGLGDVPRQRLLAEHHLAGAGGGDGDLLVGVVGRADVDQIDVGRLDHLAPVGLDAFVAPDLGEGLGLFGVAPADDLQRGAVLDGEEVVQAFVSVRVGPAHEAVADHSDSQFLGHLQILQ